MNKRVYEAHEETTAMNYDEVMEWRKSNNEIQVSKVQGEIDETDDTKPCLTFEHAFHNMPGMLEKLKNQKFSKPTPIQAKVNKAYFGCVFRFIFLTSKSLNYGHWRYQAMM